MVPGMNLRIRAYALRVWDLICSLGAPPYSYDPKGTFSHREILPRTYSLAKAIRMAERWDVPPVKLRQRRRFPAGRRPRIQYSHVLINRAFYSVTYIDGKAKFPAAIKERMAR